MKKEDERQRGIHAESARNSFFIATALIGALLVWRTIPSGEIDSGLMAIFLATQLTYAGSILYYRENGLKDSLSLSSLRSD
jgi:hypothetical protein